MYRYLINQHFFEDFASNFKFRVLPWRQLQYLFSFRSYSLIIMEINYTDIIVNHLVFKPCTDVVLFVNANASSFCASTTRTKTQQHIQFPHKPLITETWFQVKIYQKLSNLFCVSYGCNTNVIRGKTEIQNWLPKFAKFKFTDIIHACKS